MKNIKAITVAFLITLFGSSYALAEFIMGNPEKNKISYKENLIKKVARRGVISKKDILKGERLTLSNTAIKRPLKGIDAKFFSEILGKKVNKKIKINTPIRWEMLFNK